MINFATLQGLTIPDGVVTQIAKDGVVLWIQGPKLGYVSLGDSIAAGDTIDEDWESNYGTRSQYDNIGDASTVIVSGCYTDLIRNELKGIYPEHRVVATSYAHSGDTVADLMDKLSHNVVRKSVERADFVTICIGANEVLQPALNNIDEYINAGDLSNIEALIENNLTRLNTDSDQNSYMSLFKKLIEINPNAQYVFTTVYNPYKYLWIEEGHYGFFEPLLQTIPDMEILGLDIDSFIKDSLLGTPIVQQVFDRMNGLDDWCENYVTRLNSVLRNKINAYGKSNIKLADTKAVYDPVPDREIESPKHYNDLVSVEYTRGYDSMQMDWGKLYEGIDAGTFWLNLATRYVSLSGLDINGLANELVPQIVEKVIIPDINPHPEWYGHHALRESFADALGWKSLTRHTITYAANGGSGSMASQVVVALDNMTAYTNVYNNVFTPVTGYYFTGWNTKADGTGTTYSNGQLIGVSSAITLYAQWSNIYTLTFKHSQGDVIQFDSGQTGPMECYALWIDGVEQSDLGAFSNPPRVLHLPYGTSIGVIAQTKSGDGRSYITLNGTKVNGNSKDARYTFTLTSDMTINYEWNQWLSGIIMQSYWSCYVTTY